MSGRDPVSRGTQVPLMPIKLRISLDLTAEEAIGHELERGEELITHGTIANTQRPAHSAHDKHPKGLYVLSLPRCGSDHLLLYLPMLRWT